METTSVIAAVVSAAMAIISGVFALLGWKSYRAGIRHVMRHEHDILALERSPVFWKGILGAWCEFRTDRGDLPSDIQDLLRSSGPPPGVQEDTEPLDYLPHGGSPHQIALWDFATRIYPPQTRGNQNQLFDATLIPASSIEGFLDARSAWGGFWDKWANRLSPEQISAAQPYTGQAAFIFLLTYLDIAHRQWTGERGKGKGRMYVLANVMHAND